MSKPPVPASSARPPAPAVMDDDPNDPVGVALRGVNGKVKNAVVTKIRTLVDKDPEAFVRGMRQFLYQGGSKD
ncbi:MAG: hypothetical protein SF002_12815 [Alphaproteobacteria bacterium]|nr:hypothetical protein [Alphaproteobacteria bacterium]